MQGFDGINYFLSFVVNLVYRLRSCSSQGKGKDGFFFLDWVPFILLVVLTKYLERGKVFCRILISQEKSETKDSDNNKVVSDLVIKLHYLSIPGTCPVVPPSPSPIVGWIRPPSTVDGLWTPPEILSPDELGRELSTRPKPLLPSCLTTPFYFTVPVVPYRSTGRTFRGDDGHLFVYVVSLPPIGLIPFGKALPSS